MNFLGHLTLSGFDPELTTGNFIADRVKGKKYKNYPEKIQKGIILHRKIDYFTDNHEAVLEGCDFVAREHGKFAPILMDMYIDYFLAKNFNQYFSVELKDFQTKIWAILDEQEKYFPEEIKLMYRYMKKGEWLVNYQYKTGLEKSLRGLSKRVKYDNKMDRGIEVLNLYEKRLENIFKTFYPEIHWYCQNLIQEDNIV